MKNKILALLTALFVAAGSICVCASGTSDLTETFDAGISVKEISSSAGEYSLPECAVDGRAETCWSAEGPGQWLLFELAESACIDRVSVSFNKNGGDAPLFSIQCSADGKSYETLYTGRWNGYINTVTYSFEARRAKYVKITGFEEHNSISEAVIGSNGVTAVPLSDYMLDVTKEKLNKIDAIGDYLFVWLTHLYDNESGGFYASVSQHEKKAELPTLKDTALALGFLKDYSSALNSMPVQTREKISEYLKAGGSDIAAVKAWHALGERVSADVSVTTADALQLPEYFGSEATFSEHIANLLSDSSCENVGEEIYRNAALVKAYAPQLETVFFAALDAAQSSYSGYWREEKNVSAMSDALYITKAYSVFGKRINYTDRTAGSIFSIVERDSDLSIDSLRDGLELLIILSSEYDMKYDIRARLSQSINVFSEKISGLMKPDGAFGSTAYADKIEQNESSLYGMLKFLEIRRAIYYLFGYEQTPLDEYIGDFWSYVSGERMLVEKIHPDFRLEYFTDFEEMTEGMFPVNWEGSKTGVYAAKDPWNKDNRVLCLADSDVNSQRFARYNLQSYKKFESSFRILYERAGKNNLSYFTVLYSGEVGKSDATLFSLITNESAGLSIRLNNYNSASMTSLKEGEWYEFKIIGEWTENNAGEKVCNLSYYVKSDLDGGDYVHLGDFDNMISHYTPKIACIAFQTGGSYVGSMYIDDIYFKTTY